MNVAAWTRVYWPAALFVCVSAFVGVPAGDRGATLLACVAVLGVPELAMIITRRYQDTLSEWVWYILNVTRNQPMRQWSAAHFLAFGMYLVLAADVVSYTWHLGVALFGTAAVVAVWLTRHLFFHWWS